MIGIKLDGHDEFLELDPDTSISLKLENPILADGERISPGSFSYPFNIPAGKASPANAAKLKNPDVIENNESFSLQNATLFFGGLPLKKGTLKGNTANGQRINSNFVFGLSQVNPNFKTARLRDVVAENIVIDATAITKKIFVKRTTAGDWNVTVNGKNYTGSTANDIKTQMVGDYWDSLDSGQYVATCAEITSGSSPSGLITATYLEISLSLRYSYYDEILEMTFELDQVSTDPLHELHVQVDTPADYLVESFDMDGYYDAFDTFIAGYLTGSPYPTEKFRFPVCFNADPYGTTELIKESEVVNGVDSAGLIRNDANWGLNNSAPLVVKNYNSLQPFMRLKWVLDKIATAFDFELEGDFYTDADVANMLIHNTASLDVPQNYIGEKKFVFWKRSFNLSELVPDVSVVEFLAMLQSRYNFAAYNSDRTLKVRLQLRENIALDKDYTDITAISSPLRDRDDMRTTGYTLRCPKEDTDLLSVEESITQGTAQREYVVKCGAIRQTGAVIIETQTLVGPRVKQKNGNKFGLRVFYYAGIEAGASFDWPKANTDGATIYESLNNFVLLTGIHDRFWKYWLHFERNRIGCKLDVNYAARLLRNFNWEEKNRFDRVDFLVKSIDVKLTNTKVEVSEVEIYTMR